ncbi:hypothetical protein GQ55_2G117200 [Panicum hallii var. hallii]|uniref:Bifunctional inhibitor/plant lipid transfer protein/seed storage helical domain-containing protein n=1 Tax=Panicum hallii var. hallii TaxID=1504633 RepID=A0A2T7ENY8_9POAL|nr:hypothetical protein GQ55_2G117200 [Panicum hallii var. hallii]
MVARQRQQSSRSVKPLAHRARMHGRISHHSTTTACNAHMKSVESNGSSAETSTSTYPKSPTLYKAMAATGWSLVVVVGAAVAAAAVALSCSSRCAAAAAAFSRPLAYAAGSDDPSPPKASLDCGTVTSLLAGCGAFVRRGEAAPSPSVPAPGAACCEGVAELYAVAADSADNWRSVCGCMAGLVRRYSSNASAIALLPVLCGVLPPTGCAVGDTLTYCTSPP